MCFRPAAAGWLALLLALPGAVRAQGWTVDAAAGRAVHDPVSARIGSTVASLGLAYESAGGGRWLYLSGGTPLGDPGPSWGAGGAGGWIGTRGPVALGASVGAHVFGHGRAGENPSGGGATVDVLPTLALGAGPVRAELFGGLLATGDVAGDSTSVRTFLNSGARLALFPSAALELSAEARYLSGEGGAWPYAGGGATLRHAAGEIWGFGGAWLADDLPEPTAAWGAGASLRLGRRAELRGEVRQDPVDPVYFNASRRTWTVQLRLHAGGARAAAAPGVLFPAVAGGRATFRLPRAEYPERPVLLGDFSGWEPVEMVEDGRYWSATLPLGVGVHHYGFRTADGRFFVPPYLPAVDDGMGGTSAVLVVP